MTPPRSGAPTEYVIVLEEARGVRMPRGGGAKPGAGRPKGAKAGLHKKLGEAFDMAGAPSREGYVNPRVETMLEFALHAINDDGVSLEDKVRIMYYALGYTNAKKAEAPLGKKAQKQQEAEGVSGRFQVPTAPPMLSVVRRGE